MQENLSVKKVYVNALKYVASHLGTFSLLTILYFLGNLLPMLIGLNSFKAVIIVYYYLFLYLAAGRYYKQQFILDKDILGAAAMRFLTVSLLFLASILICSLMLNLILDFIRHTLFGGEGLVFLIVHSTYWQVVKYLFIFVLFVVFFVIPSFAFVSVISGKSRSILTTYVKTKGNHFRIAVTSAIAYFLLSLVIGICFLFKINSFVAEFMRDIVLVFIMIVYFKMYDFFYKIPQSKQQKKETKNEKNIEIKITSTAKAKKGTKNTVSEKSSENINGGDNAH